MKAEEAKLKSLTSQKRYNEFINLVIDDIKKACDTGDFSVNIFNDNFSNKPFRKQVAEHFESLGYRVFDEKMPEHNNMVISWG